MWSETIGYREYLHPYLPDFFRSVAEAIPLTGTEDLLDLGCGVGEVALGFAPFVASLTGMDLEQPMLDALGNKALATGVNIRLIQSRVEDAPEDLGRFHLITMGRAHWFMHTPTSLVRLDQWLMPGGAILVCWPVPNPDNFSNGPIMEKHLTHGLIYRRHPARNPQDPTSWGKVGRNETCPCGSGKRFKHCHGRYG
jgi:2-polyprenyl-3-methyl-5-hydroxy-6-metoxy-1,4-benzoquinol methylase